MTKICVFVCDCSVKRKGLATTSRGVGYSVTDVPLRDSGSDEDDQGRADERKADMKREHLGTPQRGLTVKWPAVKNLTVRRSAYRPGRF